MKLIFKYIDFDNHTARYFCIENGIFIEYSKDVLIDELICLINQLQENSGISFITLNNENRGEKI